MKKYTDHKEALIHYQCPNCDGREYWLKRLYSEHRFNTEYIDCECGKTSDYAVEREYAAVQDFRIIETIDDSGNIKVHPPELIDEYQEDFDEPVVSCEYCEDIHEYDAYRYYDDKDIPVSETTDEEIWIVCETCGEEAPACFDSDSKLSKPA